MAQVEVTGFVEETVKLRKFYSFKVELDTDTIAVSHHGMLVLSDDQQAEMESSLLDQANDDVNFLTEADYMDGEGRDATLVYAKLLSVA